MPNGCRREPGIGLDQYRPVPRITGVSQQEAGDGGGEDRDQYLVARRDRDGAVGNRAAGIVLVLRAVLVVGYVLMAVIVRVRVLMGVWTDHGHELATGPGAGQTAGVAPCPPARLGHTPVGAQWRRLSAAEKWSDDDAAQRA